MSIVFRVRQPRSGSAATRRPRLIVVALLAGLGATPAQAEFSAEPYIQGGFRYDSHPRYRPSDENPDSAWGTIFDVRLPMELRSQRASITLDPRLVYSFYPDSDEDDLEDRDKYLTGLANWMSPRSNVGARYGLTNLALRTSEFDSAGGSGGAGNTRIYSRGTQERWYFQPYWQYNFSPANSFTLDGGYEEVRYDEVLASRRFDYDYSYTSAMLTHAFNTRHSVALQGRWTKFDSQNKDSSVRNNSETNTLSLIYEYTWSETTTLSADVGWARTKNEVQRPNNFDPVTGPFCDPILIPFFPCETKSDSTNFVGNLTAVKNTETVEYKVVVGQSITPNSNGAEVLRFNIDASARKRFTERVSGRLGILAFTQNDVGTTDRDFERDYIRVNLRLNYRFAEHWSIYGAYAHTFNDQQDLLFGSWTVRNNFLSAGITFKGDGWRW